MPTQLQAALEEQIKDLYSAEMQLTKALPKMARAAASATLRAGFEQHLQETLEHVERIKQAAEIVETKPAGKKCVAMEGLIEEGSETIEEHGKGPLRDALLIAAAQRVEHYEIAAYGTVRAIAQQLGQTELVRLFERTLKEEKMTDEKLTKVSVGEVLVDASQLDEQEEGEDESSPKPRAGAGGNGTGGRAGASKQRR